MSDDDGRLQFVGAGVAASLVRAAARFERLVEGISVHGGDFLAARM
ncbi:MAG TPA: hypothetical protein VHB69_09220 [Mycobacteriales bacterium]|nr:hypothetical protein [Mycobacteriales bacterium]